MKVICTKVGAHQECSNCGASQPHDPICCEPCGFVEGAACRRNTNSIEPIIQVEMKTEKLDVKLIMKYLKITLGEKKITITDLGRRVGVSKTNLTQSLNGNAGMNLDTFLKLADELGVEIVFPDIDSIREPSNEVGMLKREIEIYKEVIALLGVSKSKNDNVC